MAVSKQICDARLYTHAASAATGAAVRSFHLLAKPSGSTCNIDCDYCFFLSKKALYPDSWHRMSPRTLEAYIRQLLEAHRGPEVVVAWQGGEPSLMKREFFDHAMSLIELYRRPGQVVRQTFQTNGLLIDDEWCAFFKRNKILVGISIDGPRQFHDANRKDRRGEGTFDLVVRGLKRLRDYRVDFNVLCTVNAANQDHGREVYRFFRDELEAHWMQFIPIVERATVESIENANAGWRSLPGGERPLYIQAGSVVTSRSVESEKYGRFLIDIYEEWLRRDIGRTFVQMFDVTLEAYFGRHLLCIHAPTCGRGPALEHNGDLYACDHFVEPKHKVGNIHEVSLDRLVCSEQMRDFGSAKRDLLTEQCRNCRVRVLCNGGCPKDRFVTSRDGEGGHNYLCEGLQLFFNHTRPSMQVMAHLLRQGRSPSELMSLVGSDDLLRDPYSPCPCGSGRKFRFCHGDRSPAKTIV